MGFVQTYYNIHLRSLFISKFVYAESRAVTNLSGAAVSIRGGAGGYSLMGLFFLLLTGYLPVATFQNTSGYTKARVRPLSVSGFLGRTEIFQLVGRLHVLYWVSLEQASQLSSLFRTACRPGAVLLVFKAIFYIFFELDAMSGFSYAALRAFTGSWVFDILFALRGHPAGGFTLLRALGVPVAK